MAYRKKPQGSIFSDKTTPFIAIPNTRRYTAADPFLFTENGTTYLFAELYDKKDGLGKLGYAVYDGERFSPWKIVISEPYHLSYPNIFRQKGEIYIVPEASADNTLYAYKAVSFPDQWEKCEPILTGRCLVDTTFWDKDGKRWMFTYDIASQTSKKLYLYTVDKDGRLEQCTDTCVSSDDASARPGGNFFQYKKDWIRVSQDCTGDYGVAVVFSKVLACSEEGYAEERLLRISPKDVRINRRFLSGLHTYNANDEMEVIDFHVIDFDPMTQVRRIMEKLGLRK
ncbi:MAG: hypothetical protein IJK89_11215 [Clostridia bacterium]|nr:hypothetical protein [Clostridia bacterium]